MEKHNFSIEFFPPKTPEGAEKLRVTRAKLSELESEVFFGDLRRRRQHAAAARSTPCSRSWRPANRPHRTCPAWAVRANRSAPILADFKAHGIKRIVALRGDLPSGYGAAGEFRYANELVEFIRAETGDWFHIEVAAYPEVHPQARSPQDDLQAFARKVKAGANAAITQYFYNADAYFQFVEQTQQDGHRRAHRGRHHADHELHAADALFGHVRRGNPALGATETGQLRRRQRVHQGLRPGRGDGLVRTLAGRRRARLAFLQHEPGGAHHRAVAAPGE